MARVKLTEEEKKAKARARTRAWRLENIDRARAACRAWHEANKEYTHSYRQANKSRISNNNRAWNAANKEYKKQINRAWDAANKERKKHATKDWIERNKERVKRTTKVWRESNKDRISTIGRKWRAINKEKVLTAKSSRRARALRATVTYCDTGAILAIHRNRIRNNKHSRLQLHVDHKVPLVPISFKNNRPYSSLDPETGMYYDLGSACGLEVHYNLQLLTAEENLKKGNRYQDVDDYAEEIGIKGGHADWWHFLNVLQDPEFDLAA